MVLDERDLHLIGEGGRNHEGRGITLRIRKTGLQLIANRRSFHYFIKVPTKISLMSPVWFRFEDLNPTTSDVI